MPRHSAQNLALHALRFHGPMSDAVLAWWLGRLGVKPGTAKKARWKLAKAGLVRFAGKVIRTSKGRLQAKWEVVR